MEASARGPCPDTRCRWRGGRHFLRADQDPEAAIERLGRRGHAVHLKDFVDQDTEVMPGKGRLDMVAALGALRRSGFSTAYVLEYEADENDPTPAVQQAVHIAADSEGDMQRGWLRAC